MWLSLRIDSSPMICGIWTMTTVAGISCRLTTITGCPRPPEMIDSQYLILTGMWEWLMNILIDMWAWLTDAVIDVEEGFEVHN